MQNASKRDEMTRETQHAPVDTKTYAEGNESQQNMMETIFSKQAERIDMLVSQLNSLV